MNEAAFFANIQGTTAIAVAIYYWFGCNWNSDWFWFVGGQIFGRCCATT